MKAAFINGPWWEFEDTNNPAVKALRAGVRAGSRWPHTNPALSKMDDLKFGKYSPYPMFMGYAATYAALKADADVLFRDSIARHESYERFFQWLRVAAPDFIFMESATPSWAHDQQLIARIHQLLPAAKIAVCGTITSVKSDEVLALPGVVASIKGEYEKNAVKVINGATGILEHDLLSAEEMNAAPFPYYDETMLSYADGCPHGVVFPHAQVWTSRGCAFRCSMCAFPAVMTGNDPDGTKPRKIRFYGPDYMEAFFTDLRDRWGFKSLWMDGDMENAGDGHTRHICAVMRKVGLPWAAMCRADTVSREVWQEMKDSGCYGVKIGFESGSDRIVNQVIGKHLDIEAAVETGAFLTKIGINWHGTFMAGNPTETKEEMEMTYRLIKRCIAAGMTSHQLSGTALIDGTPLDTIRRIGPLKKYPGAVIDKDFDQERDGVKKANHIHGK